MSRKGEMSLQSNFKAVDSSGSIRAKTVIVNIGASDRENWRHSDVSKSSQREATKSTAQPVKLPGGPNRSQQSKKKKNPTINRNSLVTVATPPDSSTLLLKSQTLVGTQKRNNTATIQNPKVVFKDIPGDRNNTRNTTGRGRGSKTGKNGQEDGNFSEPDNNACNIS